MKLPTELQLAAWLLLVTLVSAWAGGQEGAEGVGHLINTRPLDNNFTMDFDWEPNTENRDFAYEEPEQNPDKAETLREFCNGGDSSWYLKYDGKTPKCNRNVLLAKEFAVCSEYKCSGCEKKYRKKGCQDSFLAKEKLGRECCFGSKEEKDEKRTCKECKCVKKECCPNFRCKGCSKDYKDCEKKVKSTRRNAEGLPIQSQFNLTAEFAEGYPPSNEEISSEDRRFDRRMISVIRDACFEECKECTCKADKPCKKMKCFNCDPEVKGPKKCEETQPYSLTMAKRCLREDKFGLSKCHYCKCMKRARKGKKKA